jgi:hypothetical protein
MRRKTTTKNEEVSGTMDGEQKQHFGRRRGNGDKKNSLTVYSREMEHKALRKISAKNTFRNSFSAFPKHVHGYHGYAGCTSAVVNRVTSTIISWFRF